MMTETVCYKKIFENISANDAFNSLGNENFYCLVYSPAFCGFSSPDKILDVFEMRCFNEKFELRWARNSYGKGRAVIMSETQTLDGFDMETENSEVFYKIPGQYVLWGTGKEIDGKNLLFEQRTGKIEVPFNVRAGKRVFLNFDEFFSPDSEHGNMIWRFERLTGLSDEARNKCI